MIKSILSKLGSALSSGNRLITFNVNDRIGPIDRSLTYTEPIANFLQSKNWGKVVNEGTFLQKSGEISGCDIQIELIPHADFKLFITQIASVVEELGMPKGSNLIIERTNKQIKVGRMEGLALYLTKNFNNNAGLSTEEVENFARSLHDTVGHTNLVDRSWSGEKEEAAYFYNTSFQEMQEDVQECLVRYNLMEFSRIVQIA